MLRSPSAKLRSISRRVGSARAWKTASRCSTLYSTIWFNIEPQRPQLVNRVAYHNIYERFGYPLPPATFEFLTISLKTQAEIQLGLLHFGEEKDRPQPDLRSARHIIDMLSMIQEKTKGNLSMEEQRLIENSLTELRFRYVQSMEQAKKEPASPEPPPVEEKVEEKAEQPA